MNSKENTRAYDPNAFDISPTLRRHLVYPRFRREQGCALILDAGYFIQRECVSGFRQNGWKTVSLSVAPAESFIGRLLIAIIDHRPDLLFTVNHLGFDSEGVLTTLLESIELPIVSWYVDSPAYILLDHQKNVSELTITPIWERAYSSFMQQFGFRNVFHLPLAGDPTVFSGRSHNVGAEYEVGFVGDSMTGAVRKWLAKSPEFAGRNEFVTVVAEKLSRGTVSIREDIFPQSMSNVAVSISDLSNRERLTLESTVVLEATRLKRKRMVETFRGEGLHVFGDDGWRSYLPQSVRLHPGPDYYRKLPHVYQATKINLNSTSAQMPTTVNQRVFDAPLAGGFILTDAQPELEELFTTGEEVVTYSELEELPELNRYYQYKHDLRAKIVRQAASRIQAQHTYRHRIAKIIESASELVGSQRTSVAVAV